MSTNDAITNGIDTLLNHLRLISDTYNDLLRFASADLLSGKIVKIKDKDMLVHALTLFGPQIKPSEQHLPLHELYEIAIHRKTGAIIVCTQTATFTSTSTLFSLPFVTHFQTYAIYMPGLGVEIASVGRIGEVCSKPFVLRSESACGPSFFLGSTQCNCGSPWRCTQELAAFYNSAQLSKRESIGFLMIYLESQNGMGMGYSQDTFSTDLGTRAHLRHAAGLVASQKHQLSIQETFVAMGLPQDPRRAEDGAGYKITPIILDFIGAHVKPILLSNNPMKIQVLNNFGYSPQRLKILGEITCTGQAEARQRSQLFDHLDIGPELTSFEAEFNRLKQQIHSTYPTEETYVD